MQFVFGILLTYACIFQLSARKQNTHGVFEGRLARAHNTAIASIIAKEVNNKSKNEAKKESIVGGAIFVTPQEVIWHI